MPPNRGPLIEGDGCGSVLVVGALVAFVGVAFYNSPEYNKPGVEREGYRELAQPIFEDVNGDGVLDRITERRLENGEIEKETFYGVDLPTGRRIYIPKDQFDGEK